MVMYVINSCNQWHEYSSFKLIGVVDERHLEEAERKIKKEYKYNDEDFDSYIDIQSVEVNDLDL